MVILFVKKKGEIVNTFVASATRQFSFKTYFYALSYVTIRMLYCYSSFILQYHNILDKTMS